LYYSIFYSCLLLVAIGIYAYGWETPKCDPPGCNLPAPINAGLDPQTKAGNLTIGGNLTTGGFTMSAGAGANKVLTTNASGVATWQEASGGGIASDLDCIDCIGPTEITDSYVLNTGDAMTGDLSMGNKKITNLATPTASTDAATKAYVDGKSLFCMYKRTCSSCSAAGCAASATCDAGYVRTGGYGILMDDSSCSGYYNTLSPPLCVLLTDGYKCYSNGSKYVQTTVFCCKAN